MLSPIWGGAWKRWDVWAQMGPASKQFAELWALKYDPVELSKGVALAFAMSNFRRSKVKSLHREPHSGPKGPEGPKGPFGPPGPLRVNSGLEGL